MSKWGIGEWNEGNAQNKCRNAGNQRGNWKNRWKCGESGLEFREFGESREECGESGLRCRELRRKLKCSSRNDRE